MQRKRSESLRFPSVILNIYLSIDYCFRFAFSNCLNMLAVYYKGAKGHRGSFALCANPPSGTSGEKTLVDYLTNYNRCARGSLMKIFADSVRGIPDSPEEPDETPINFSLQEDFNQPRAFFEKEGLVSLWISRVRHFKRIFGRSPIYKIPEATERGDTLMVKAIGRLLRHCAKHMNEERGCPPVGKPTQTEQEADGLEDVIDVYDPDFTAELLQRGYGVTEIEGDGNCLFRAVSQSLFGTE